VSCGGYPTCRFATYLPYLKGTLQSITIARLATEAENFFRQAHVLVVYRSVVSLHHITWRATVGAVEDETLLADAIAWLVGDPELIDIEQTSSYHGSQIHMVTGVSKKKQQSLKSLSRIGVHNLEKLSSELEQRFDENNTLHFRLDIHSFIDGEVVIAAPGQQSTIKCQTKVEVYPGQDPMEQCKMALQEAMKKVENNDIESILQPPEN